MVKMDQYKIVLLLFVACCWLSLTKCNVVAPKGPLRSHITGGYKSIQARSSSRLVLDCKQYASDYDVLYHFSFLIMVNPMTYQWEHSTAEMDSGDSFVTSLVLRDMGSSVPESIFCLKKLQYLHIENMHFMNDIVPDTLANLRQLYTLQMSNTPIINMTEKLTSLMYLSNIYLVNCSLSYLPDFAGMFNLQHLDLRQNRLSQIDGLHSIYYLYLDNNLFTELPILTAPENVRYLSMNTNPLKHVMTLSSFINMYDLQLSNTTLKLIPPTIDKLQNLQYLNLANNKLFYLPKNILKLAKLKYLYIHDNLFSANEVETIQRQFSTNQPNVTLTI
jgi:Leucine-rich repeat (LRR) protein